jgi:glyoxalase family protein
MVGGMELEGIHHVTCITADAPANVEFYAGTLGLRLVKKTVNQDDPTVYHLFYADEKGSPGADLTFFEYPGARPGRAGAGMIHTIQLGVPSEASLEFWAERLEGAGYRTRGGERSLAFDDYDGLHYELVVAASGNPPLRAEHPEVPAEHAIIGVEGARAYIGRGAEADRDLLVDTLGFTESAQGEYVLHGEDRHFTWGYDATSERGVPGAGTVHHIAWHSRDEDHVPWQERVAAAGMQVTPVIDRDYFLSIYFREPQGVLFEIATTSPGFAVDEDPEHLGEALRLPSQHEHLRPQLERLLTPLTNPRAAARQGAGS